MEREAEVFSREVANFAREVLSNCTTVLVSNLIGKISVLEMLILSPKHSPKKLRILCKWSISRFLGDAKSTASSAYSEHRRFAALGKTGFRNKSWSLPAPARLVGKVCANPWSPGETKVYPYHSMVRRPRLWSKSYFLLASLLLSILCGRWGVVGLCWKT